MTTALDKYNALYKLAQTADTHGRIGDLNRKDTKAFMDAAVAAGYTPQEANVIKKYYNQYKGIIQPGGQLAATADINYLNVASPRGKVEVSDPNTNEKHGINASQTGNGSGSVVQNDQNTLTDADAFDDNSDFVAPGTQKSTGNTSVANAPVGNTGDPYADYYREMNANRNGRTGGNLRTWIADNQNWLIPVATGLGGLYAGYRWGQSNTGWGNNRWNDYSSYGNSRYDRYNDYGYYGNSNYNWGNSGWGGYGTYGWGGGYSGGYGSGYGGYGGYGGYRC